MPADGFEYYDGMHARMHVTSTLHAEVQQGSRR